MDIRGVCERAHTLRESRTTADADRVSIAAAAAFVVLEFQKEPGVRFGVQPKGGTWRTVSYYLFARAVQAARYRAVPGSFAAVAW